MNNKHFAKLVLAASGAVLSVFAFETSPAGAVDIRTYDFSFTTTPGFAAAPSAVGRGRFAFDLDLATGAEFEFVPVSNFEFDFLGRRFTLTNPTPNGDVLVSFNPGREFLGINYSTNFILAPDLPNGLTGIDLAESTAFIARGATSSLTTIRYTETTVIPTPALLPGLIGFGVAALRKKRDEQAA